VDPEVTALRETRKAKEKELTAMRGEARKAEQRAARIIKLQTDIADIEAKIAARDTTTKPTTPRTIADPDIARLTEQKKAATAELADIRAEEKAKADVADQIADLQRRIRERDFTHAAKPSPTASPDLLAARATRDDLTKQLKELEGPTTLSDAERLTRYRKYLDKARWTLKRLALG
jgi:capsule polysaccharide export protein KpsE/RkpR